MTVPLRRSRPYLFWGQTTSLCETCLKLVPAKIEIRDNEVWYQKRCPQHGIQTTLVSTDAAYWKLCKDYLKPGDRPLSLQSRTEYGCPYDCGLCPDHEQHSCLALIGPFTLFHILSFLIFLYALVMIATAPTPRAADDRAFA